MPNLFSSSDSLVRLLLLVWLVIGVVPLSSALLSGTLDPMLGKRGRATGEASEKIVLTLSAYDGRGGVLIKEPASFEGARRRPVFAGLLNKLDGIDPLPRGLKGSMLLSTCCFFGGEAREVLAWWCRFIGDSLGSSG